MSRPQIMVDIETMGIRSSSRILSIGACQFNADSILNRYYVVVDQKSLDHLNFTTDQSTVDWWAQQGEEVIAAWGNGQGLSIHDALAGFTEFLNLSEVNNTQIWCLGASFDFPILTYAFDQALMTRPWQYTRERCLRTIRQLFKLDPNQAPERVGTHHNALDDAMYQAQYLQAIDRRYDLHIF